MNDHFIVPPARERTPITAPITPPTDPAPPMRSDARYRVASDALALDERVYCAVVALSLKASRTPRRADDHYPRAWRVAALLGLSEAQGMVEASLERLIAAGRIEVVS